MKTQNTSSEKPKLWAHNLLKTYTGRKVVNDVSVGLDGGEVVGLLGPNGAGKTTSFYMIVGLTAVDSGSIILNGENITKEPMYIRARLGLGYLPQEASVFRKLTVSENIMAILETLTFEDKSQRKKLMQQRHDQLIEELGLTHVLNNMASSLSGGERRRVEIARALVRNPAFMLLDEPFAGIDPIVINDIQEIIQKLRAKGIGVLITDHNVRSTLEICDRAYILADGKVVEEGAPDFIAQSEKAKRFYLGDNFNF